MGLLPKAQSMLSILALALGFCRIVAAVNFQSCLADLQAGKFGSVDGALNYYGHKETNVSRAVGLTFSACKSLCGTGHEPFRWTAFSDQFTTWLLPWLALISQLPYGAGDSLKNFESMILAVGSPMLAAYSLALSVNGNRWMVERLRRSDYPNNFFAADVLSSLQQVSFKLPEDVVLKSLIVSPKKWWSKLSQSLAYSGSQWTLSAIFSMVYVALAYVFIWINTISSNSDTQAYPNGQSLGSIWLSLLPIVICSLQLSSKTDIGRITEAIQDADKEWNNGAKTIIIRKTSGDVADEDVVCPTPIFFFTRVSTWLRAAAKVTDSFSRAAEFAEKAPTPSPNQTSGQNDENKENLYSYDLFNIHVKSMLLALFLQWGTGGASLMAMYLTPAPGLGCIGGAQLVFLSVSTTVWLLSALSGVLVDVHQSSGHQKDGLGLISGLPIALRRVSKNFAALNAIWILVSSLLQMATLENSCYCKACIIDRGKKGWVLLQFPPNEFGTIRAYWLLSALVFLIAVNILIKRPRLKRNFDGEESHIME